MDSKFYVSLEVAKLLREKWYDGKRDFLTPVYTKSGCLYWSNHEDLSNEIPAITKDEAIDWLESKGIVVQTIPSTPNMWRWRLFSMKYITYDDHTEDSEILYTTRLEAKDAAIINALELL